MYVIRENPCRLEKALDGTSLQDVGAESWEGPLDGVLSWAGAIGSEAQSGASSEDVFLGGGRLSVHGTVSCGAEAEQGGVIGE